jgi:hypothetical protein
MPSNDKNKKGTLEIFIHKNAFYNCLVRKHVWNGILGANCLFKRTPNIHYPTDIFSLNYFALSFNQLAALAN